ncbi:MAG: hypothetical protein ACTTGZ_01580 [Treponema sp.]
MKKTYSKDLTHSPSVYFSLGKTQDKIFYEFLSHTKIEAGSKTLFNP